MAEGCIWGDRLSAFFYLKFKVSHFSFYFRSDQLLSCWGVMSKGVIAWQKKFERYLVF